MRPHLADPIIPTKLELFKKKEDKSELNKLFGKEKFYQLINIRTKTYNLLEIVVYFKNIYNRLKGLPNKMGVKSTLLYSVESWLVKNIYVKKIKITEM